MICASPQFIRLDLPRQLYIIIVYNLIRLFSHARARTRGEIKSRFVLSTKSCPLARVT